MQTRPATCVASVRAAHTQFHVLPTARSTPENTTHLAASDSCDRNTRLANLSDSSRPTPSISRRRRRAPALASALDTFDGAGTSSSHVRSVPVEAASGGGAGSLTKRALSPVL